MASSHVMRVPPPWTSFIGYFRRRSPITSSRTAAPLAQCEPRLIGESQLGSWPIQTPFETSAVTVQPTEQCVQMLLRIVIPAPSAGGGGRGQGGKGGKARRGGAPSGKRSCGDRARRYSGW